MKLFAPLKIREIELKNRIVVSPMCQYSAKDGHPQTWHLVHLGSRAVGGASLVFAEATAVQGHGRISPADTGIYNDAHVASWRPIAEFIRASGAVAGIQLAHAGRKASTSPPWQGGKPVAIGEGGWEIVAPSALPFDTDYQTPRPLSLSDIDRCRCRISPCRRTRLGRRIRTDRNSWRSWLLVARISLAVLQYPDR